MKFLCIAYEREETFASMPLEEWRALREETLAYVEALSARGVLLDARPLAGAGGAAVVRVRNGAPLVTDGPFAETKEQIGGYFLLEVADRQEALTIAAGWPGARLGSIEVRPVEEALREDRRY